MPRNPFKRLQHSPSRQNTVSDTRPKKKKRQKIGLRLGTWRTWPPGPRRRHIQPCRANLEQASPCALALVVPLRVPLRLLGRAWCWCAPVTIPTLESSVPHNQKCHCASYVLHHPPVLPSSHLYYDLGLLAHPSLPPHPFTFNCATFLFHLSILDDFLPYPHRLHSL